MTRPVDYLRSVATSMFPIEQQWPVEQPALPVPPLEEVPIHPGLDGEYQDMMPGGVHKSAEMTVTKPTLDFLIDTMMSVERQRILNVKNFEAAGETEKAAEEHVLARGFLIYMLREMQNSHKDEPEGAKVTIIEEPARQSRQFIAEGGTGNVPGMSEIDVHDLKFLDTIMRGLNEHPPIAADKPVGPQLGENKYTTEDRTHYAGNTSKTA
jgi:hypothetical protein